MSNVNLSLDEFITRGRRGGAERNGVARRGAARRGAVRSGSEPQGKWKHDKFETIYGSGSQRRSGGPTKSRAGNGGGGNQRSSNGIVKLNIADLPETVLTTDLEELFQDFNIFGVTVHYNENGEHLGTADLFVNPRAARNIMREYANIAIDGQEIKIGVVDESGSLMAPRGRIQDRIRRVASNPIRRRKADAPRPSGGRGKGPIRGGKGGSGGGGQQPKKTLTTDELDKELEAYMGSRHPQITV